MPKAQETVLEINLNALKHNFDYIKSKLTSNTKFLAVVKAFAYGNDAIEIAKYLQDLDVDYFAVAYVKEGVVLRDAGISKPILILHPQPVHFETIINRCLEPNLYSLSVLNKFINVAEENNQSDYPVHLKFNTGLNRLGFNSKDINAIASCLQNTSAIKIKSAFSHLAASEDSNEDEFTKTQIETFNSIYNTLIKTLGYNLDKHICNTSGILNYPEAHFDMVRCGIGLYGFGNSPKHSKHFKPIATLKSVISQIHYVEKGESVGYNRAFKSNKSQKTATIPLGHADGIGRQYGNGMAYVTIQGQRAPIIGNVCMDMIMVNVTNINCKEGDEVIFFGESPTAEALSATANTISYELITSISQRVKRIIIK